MSEKSLERQSGSVCNEECEIYSRVTGYHRPLKNWNAGKQEEFKQRTSFILGFANLLPTRKATQEEKELVQKIMS